MINNRVFQNKNCLVLGLAKSGYVTAKLLHRLGAHVTVNDQKPLDRDSHAEELRRLGMHVIGGGHPDDLLERPFDWVVKNPGIPYHSRVVKEAIHKQIPVVTEIEIAGLISEAPIVAITGSNGKTTTTTLIGEMLKEDGKEPLVAGNIGEVACGVAAEACAENILVIECSSFQLLGTTRFHPHVSVLLNLFDAHLDYHGTRKNYEAAKARIFVNQTHSDFAVVNVDDPAVMHLAKEIKSKKIPFSLRQKFDSGACVKNGIIQFQKNNILPVREVALPGKHNLENILAAVAVAGLYGVHYDTIAAILKKFTGVKHRLQFVKTVNGRMFYNDSKATNVLATQKAITAFEEPVILLAGGLDRGNAFDALVPALRHVKVAIVFGESSGKMKQAVKAAGVNEILSAHRVEDAVPMAYRLSSPGDVILLSPACASWDQYKDFEERGDMFIESVHKLR